MDLGVGSFVYSLGLVQSLPILRDVPPGTLSSRCISALKNSIGVLILGAVRILMVKGTSYPGVSYLCFTRSEGIGSFVLMVTGTRHGIRCPLELLFHSRSLAHRRQSATRLLAQSLIFQHGYGHLFRSASTCLQCNAT